MRQKSILLWFLLTSRFHRRDYGKLEWKEPYLKERLDREKGCCRQRQPSGGWAGRMFAPLAILSETLGGGNYSLTSYKEVIKGPSVVARARSPRLTPWREEKEGNVLLYTMPFVFTACGRKATTLSHRGEHVEAMRGINSEQKISWLKEVRSTARSSPSGHTLSPTNWDCHQ